MKKALVIGIQQQSNVRSLKVIRLDHSLRYDWNRRLEILQTFTESELKEFWNAVFSLPQIEDVQIEIDMESGDMRSFIEKVHLICDCWKQLSLKKKLKSLQLGMHEEDFDTIWGEDQLMPFDTVTRDISVKVTYYRQSPQIHSYTSDIICMN